MHEEPKDVVFSIDMGGGKSSVAISEDIAPTLCTTHYGEPAVVYSAVGFEPGILKRESGEQDSRVSEEVSPTLRANMGDNQTAVAYEVERMWKNWDGGEISPTLSASNASGRQRMPDKENFNCVMEDVEYIVRRLMPQECARLQGFPTFWGTISHYDEFTDEQYEFWLGVRKTYDNITGIKRKEKEYSRERILKWYNKLHIDSNEYKMWGNGITLQIPAYIFENIVRVQGIIDGL